MWSACLGVCIMRDGLWLRKERIIANVIVHASMAIADVLRACRSGCMRMVFHRDGISFLLNFLLWRSRHVFEH